MFSEELGLTNWIGTWFTPRWESSALLIESLISLRGWWCLWIGNQLIFSHTWLEECGLLLWQGSINLTIRSITINVETNYRPDIWPTSNIAENKNFKSFLIEFANIFLNSRSNATIYNIIVIYGNFRTNMRFFSKTIVLKILLFKFHCNSTSLCSCNSIIDQKEFWRKKNDLYLFFFFEKKIP